MSDLTSEVTPETVLRNYFHAKDENRPHILTSVFTPDAELLVVSHSSNIVFPARTIGREAIGDVLVRQFAQMYENVYSFYLQPPPLDRKEFSCDWLVVMSDKQSKYARVGCGRYDWKFSSESPCLATHLTITIYAMSVLPSEELSAVIAWVEKLSYPWIRAQDAANLIPKSDLLAPVLQYLTGCAQGG